MLNGNINCVAVLVDNAVDGSFDAEMTVLFSEPMDPGSVLAFDTFTVRPQDVTGLSPIEQSVVATIEPSADLRSFRLKPTVPL